MRKLVFDAMDMFDGLAKDGEAMRGAIAGYRAAGFEVVLSMPGRLSSQSGEGVTEGLATLQALSELYDTAVFGGPCSAPRGLHLDDKAITAEEFLGLRYEALRNLVDPT
jgi:hypothetical protein